MKNIIATAALLLVLTGCTREEREKPEASETPRRVEKEKKKVEAKPRDEFDVIVVKSADKAPPFKTFMLESDVKKCAPGKG